MSVCHSIYVYVRMSKDFSHIDCHYIWNPFICITFEMTIHEVNYANFKRDKNV